MQRANPLRGKIAAVCVEIPLADFRAHDSHRFSSAQIYQDAVNNDGYVR